MDDAEATNLNFQMPSYMLPNDLANKVVAEMRTLLSEKKLGNDDVRAYLNGSRNQIIEDLAKKAISKILMHEKLSPYDEMECFSVSNENNIILQILSYF